MITILASSQQAAISPAAGVGLSLAAVGLIGGLAVAMHHRKKSPRIVGWLCFIIGIPLAGLLSGVLAYIAGLTLWSIPITMILTGYVGFVFIHDGTGRKGKPHRWLQPVYGLILPALLLTLGGGLGHGVHSVLDLIDHGVGSAVSRTTGK
jgi:ABC-type dipeptide/oligopeptide/nickel transport system permease component